MPIYEYRCTGCGAQTEVWQKMNETPALSCEACKATSFERILSASAFQLKGSGWYVTDYARKGDGGSGSGSGGSSSTGSAGGSTAGASDGAAPPSPAPAPSGTDTHKTSSATPAA